MFTTAKVSPNMCLLKVLQVRKKLLLRRMHTRVTVINSCEFYKEYQNSRMWYPMGAESQITYAAFPPDT